MVPVLYRMHYRAIVPFAYFAGLHHWLAIVAETRATHFAFGGDVVTVGAVRSRSERESKSKRY